MTRPHLPAFFPESFDADERMMIGVAEGFARERVLPLSERLEHQEDGLMPALVREAGDLGLCGVDAPDAYGGLGLGKNLAARILEFLSMDGAFSVTYGITSGISQVGLSLFGTDAQKARWLPDLTAGTAIGAYALSEPDSGSDALSARATAVRDGGDWRLNGTKAWISNAKWADLFLVMAKVDGERFSAFLVPRDAPGLTVGPEERKMGLKGSSTARLLLEDVRVPLDHLLHEEGKGHQVAFNALNIGRFKLASMSIGPARRAMEVAAAYAQERKQFGRPLAEFGLIREKFARMAALFAAAESAIYRLGAGVDAAFAESDGSVDANRAAAERYAIECAMVKVFATEAEAEIVDEALQVFGGYGFTEEFPMARIYRDARVSRIYEGTNEINRLFLADRLARAGRAPERSFQTEKGAVADLAILDFVGESLRLRAEAHGAFRAFADVFDAWATPRRLLASARARVEPPPTVIADLDWEGLGALVIERGGPLSV